MRSRAQKASSYEVQRSQEALEARHQGALPLGPPCSLKPHKRAAGPGSPGEAGGVQGGPEPTQLRDVNGLCARAGQWPGQAQRAPGAVPVRAGSPGSSGVPLLPCSGQRIWQTMRPGPCGGQARKGPISLAVTWKETASCRQHLRPPSLGDGTNSCWGHPSGASGSEVYLATSLRTRKGRGQRQAPKEGDAEP